MLILVLSSICAVCQNAKHLAFLVRTEINFRKLEINFQALKCLKNYRNLQHRTSHLHQSTVSSGVYFVYKSEEQSNNCSLWQECLHDPSAWKLGINFVRSACSPLQCAAVVQEAQIKDTLAYRVSHQALD